MVEELITKTIYQSPVLKAEWCRGQGIGLQGAEEVTCLSFPSDQTRVAVVPGKMHKNLSYFLM